MSSAGKEDASEVHAFLLAGQSNMSGRAQSSTPVLQPEERLLQYGAHRRRIERAPAILDMHDLPSGISYASFFAREYLRMAGEGVTVLLIPAAHGGTGFTSTTQDPAPPGYSTHEGGTWQVGYTGSDVNLYELMLRQTTEALEAVKDCLGVVPTLRALMWHQGETDALNGAPGEVYGAHLRALIDGVRSHVENPRLPVVVGGMSPEWMSRVPSSEPIHRAHADLPASRLCVSFVPGRRGAGRSGDVVHYGVEGARHLGIDSVLGFYAATTWS